MAMPEALAGPWKISAGQPHAADTARSQRRASPPVTPLLSTAAALGAHSCKLCQHIGQGRGHLQGAPWSRVMRAHLDQRCRR